MGGGGCGFVVDFAGLLSFWVVIKIFAAGVERARKISQPVSNVFKHRRVAGMKQNCTI